jgi:hypothetical protein
MELLVVKLALSGLRQPFVRFLARFEKQGPSRNQGFDSIDDANQPLK